MSHPLIDGLGVSPDVFIHNFDIVGDRALIIRLSAEQRRNASFLDDRILGRGVEGGWANWADIEPAARRAPTVSPAFIFHVGHCGSTLISRLLEEASGVRSLREPMSLRTFATVLADSEDGVSLWSAEEVQRRLSCYLNVATAGAPTLFKATSWCGALAKLTAGPALFCHSRADAYIATMLGGANNPIDLKLNAPIRLRRLRRLCGGEIARLSALSPGELAAMSWAAETATIAAAMTRDAGRFHPIEFDDFLKAPADGLAAAAAHLGLAAPPEKIAAALSGPLMRTYSKDASFDYSPKDRKEILADYLARHKREIERGVKWLGDAAGAHAAIRAGAERFA